MSRDQVVRIDSDWLKEWIAGHGGVLTISEQYVVIG